MSALEEFGCFPVALDFHLDSHVGPFWEVKNLRGGSGWLAAAEARLETPFDTICATLLVACDEHGKALSKWQTAHLIGLETSMPREADDLPPDALSDLIDMQYWDFLGTCDLHHLEVLEAEEGALREAIAFEERRAAEVFEQAETYVAKLRRDRRQVAAGPAERQDFDRRIQAIEDKQAQAARWLLSRIADIREDSEARQADFLDLIRLDGEYDICFVAHWTARHWRDVKHLEVLRTGGMPFTDRLSPDAARTLELEAREANAKAAAEAHSRYAAILRMREEERRRQEEALQKLGQSCSPTLANPQAPATGTNTAGKPTFELNITGKSLREVALELREKALRKQEKQRAAAERRKRRKELAAAPETATAEELEDLWKRGEISLSRKQRLMAALTRDEPENNRSAPEADTVPPPKISEAPTDPALEIERMIDEGIRRLIRGD
ncbi:MAG TPA: hypothetical protein VIL84_14765 [Devosiaceae bacterium]